MAKSRPFILVCLFAVVSASAVGVARLPSRTKRNAPPSTPDFPSRREALRARARRLSVAGLARLDEIEQFEDEWSDQKLVTQKAEASYDQAHRELELAERALKEYQESTFPQERAAADSEVTLAENEARLAAAQLDLHRRGKGSEAQEAIAFDEVAVLRTKATVEQAKAKRATLIDYTNPRRVAELTKEIARTKAEARAKKSSLDLERVDEAKLERQSKEQGLTASEQEAFRLLDMAQGLLARLESIADSSARRSEGESLTGELSAILDRAEREWQRSENARSAAESEAGRHRVHAAAQGKDTRRHHDKE
jgi:uncharacterized small protein (DUF1192 family)